MNPFDDNRCHLDSTENVDTTHRLPTGFSIVSLSIVHLNDIYQFLKNHYSTTEHSVVYSKVFLLWYLKRVPKDLIVGLVYQKTLVGLITACFVTTFLYEKPITAAQIYLFCVQRKIRKCGLGRLLITDIKIRINRSNIKCALFSMPFKSIDYFCQTIDYVIPIHLTKLRKIGFLTEDYTFVGSNHCSLKLMNENQINAVATLLSTAYKDYCVKPVFDAKFVRRFLTNQSKVVYSFVNANPSVTEFVGVYCYSVYCNENVITVAKINFCAFNTLTVTQLVQSLIIQLQKLNIDQLVFNDSNHLSDIDLPKFLLNNEHYYYSINHKMPFIAANQLSILDF